MRESVGQRGRTLGVEEDSGASPSPEPTRREPSGPWTRCSTRPNQHPQMPGIRNYRQARGWNRGTHHAALDKGVLLLRPPPPVQQCESLQAPDELPRTRVLDHSPTVSQEGGERGGGPGPITQPVRKRQQSPHIGKQRACPPPLLSAFPHDPPLGEIDHPDLLSLTPSLPFSLHLVPLRHLPGQGPQDQSHLSEGSFGQHGRQGMLQHDRHDPPHCFPRLSFPCRSIGRPLLPPQGARVHVTDTPQSARQLLYREALSPALPPPLPLSFSFYAFCQSRKEGRREE